MNFHPQVGQPEDPFSTQWVLFCGQLAKAIDLEAGDSQDSIQL